jgi:hypothetical protein
VHAYTLPRADAIGHQLYERVGHRSTLPRRIKDNVLVRSVRLLRTAEMAKRDNGIVVLQRPMADVGV